MADKTEKNKAATDSLLEKSRALRARSKETENKFNELKSQVDDFMHTDRKQDEPNTQGET